MPKPHFKTAPEYVQRRIAAVRETNAIISNGGAVPFNVPAAGLLAAIQQAQILGYAWPTKDVPTPVTDELAALEKSGPTTAGLFRLRRSFDLFYEAACIKRARSLEKWASEPSAAELAEAERPERERRELEAELTARTEELVQSAERERLAKVQATARKQAERERKEALS